MSSSPPAIDWHPVSRNVPGERLATVLRRVFNDMPRDEIRRYTYVPMFNGLFDWISQESPWRAVAYCMCYGIGEDLRYYSIDEIAEYLGRPKQAVQTAVGNRTTLPSNIPLALRIAHFTLRGAPEEVRMKNEFRDPLCLKPVEWGLLAEGKIFTIDQLCARTATELKELRGIQEKRVVLIERHLKGLTPSRSLHR